MGKARQFIELILLVLLLVMTPRAHAQGTTLPPTYKISCKPTVPALSAPAVVVGVIPPAVGSTINTTYLVWVCNQPNGYATIVSLFDPIAIIQYLPQYLAGTLTVDQINAMCASLCTPLTPQEQHFVDGMTALYAPKAVVQANGPTKTRVVFTQVNGALGPQVAGRVHVGASCNAADRIPGTAYYSVKNQVDQTNTTTPNAPLGAVYALCTVSLPLAAN